MRASTSTRWSKELPGYEGHEDTGGGNSIYSRWTLLSFITVTKAILSCGEIGGVRLLQVSTMANARKEQREGHSSLLLLLPFSLRDEIHFKGCGDKKVTEAKSHIVVRCSVTSEPCLSRSIWPIQDYLGTFWSIFGYRLLSSILESLNRYAWKQIDSMKLDHVY